MAVDTPPELQGQQPAGTKRQSESAAQAGWPAGGFVFRAGSIGFSGLANSGFMGGSAGYGAGAGQQDEKPAKTKRKNSERKILTGLF